MVNTTTTVDNGGETVVNARDAGMPMKNWMFKTTRLGTRTTAARSSIHDVFDDEIHAVTIRNQTEKTQTNRMSVPLS